MIQFFFIFFVLLCLLRSGFKTSSKKATCGIGDKKELNTPLIDIYGLMEGKSINLDILKTE